MGLEKLRPEVIEEGRGHPFVEALVMHLKKRHVDVLSELESAAASGGERGYVCGLGGRAMEVRGLLLTIHTAQGVAE